MKEKLLKAIPYILIVIALAFTLYSTIELQKAENKCNTHLIDRYEKFKDDACDICMNPDQDIELIDWNTDETK